MSRIRTPVVGCSLEPTPWAKEVSAWLSPRDAAELVCAAVEADGFTFLVANGISANRYRRADLSDTMQRLNYQPVDDAWSS